MCNMGSMPMAFLIDIPFTRRLYLTVMWMVYALTIPGQLFRGTLFFNPVTYASIFFPAGGRRAATSGRLQYNGGTGFYLTSSLGNQWIDPDANYSFRNVWQMELSNFPGALSAVPGFGVSLRCVVDE